MNNIAALVPSDGANVALFELILIRQAKADAIIKLTAKMQDWPTLELAVDAKIDEQVQFLEWWDQNVGSRRGLNRHNVDQRRARFSTDAAGRGATGCEAFRKTYAAFGLVGATRMTATGVACISR